MVQKYLNINNIQEELEGVAANSAIAKAIQTFAAAIDQEHARAIVSTFNSSSMALSFHCVVGRVKALIGSATKLTLCISPPVAIGMWVVCALASQGTQGKGAMRAHAIVARDLLAEYLTELQDAVWVGASVEQAHLAKGAVQGLWNHILSKEADYAAAATLVEIKATPDKTAAKAVFVAHRSACQELVQAANGLNMTGYVISHRFLSSLFAKAGIAVDADLAQDDISWMAYDNASVYDDKLQRFVMVLIQTCETGEVAFGGGFAKYVMAITRKTELRIAVRRAIRDGLVKVMDKAK